VVALAMACSQVRATNTNAPAHHQDLPALGAPAALRAPDLGDRIYLRIARFFSAEGKRSFLRRLRSEASSI